MPLQIAQLMKDAESILRGNRRRPLTNKASTGQPRDRKSELALTIDLVNAIAFHSEVVAETTTKKSVGGAGNRSPLQLQPTLDLIPGLDRRHHRSPSCCAPYPPLFPAPIAWPINRCKKLLRGRLKQHRHALRREFVRFYLAATYRRERLAQFEEARI